MVKTIFTFIIKASFSDKKMATIEEKYVKEEIKIILCTLPSRFNFTATKYTFANTSSIVQS
jgi:hypothetical protein